MRLAVDREGDRLRILVQRFGGEHHPGIFLRARIGRRGALVLDHEPGKLDVVARPAGFGGKREQPRAVAQTRSVIGARQAAVALLIEPLRRGIEDALGACFIAEHRQCGGELRACQRRVEVIQLRIGEIAQIAHHRTAVSCKHIDGIGERRAIHVLGIGGIGNGVAQALQRLIEGFLRHRISFFARAGEEIGDECVEPSVVAGARRPQAESAGRILARQHLVDRVANAVGNISVERQPLGGCKLVDIKQRQRAADDLLRAAIGIAVERLQQSRHIDRADRRHRQRHPACAGHEIGEEIARERQTGARRQRLHAAARELAGAGTDIERERLVEVEIGTGQPQIYIGAPDAGGRDRNRDRIARTRGERERFCQCVGGSGHRPMQAECDTIASGFALDIVDLHMKARLIPDR